MAITPMMPMWELVDCYCQVLSQDPQQKQNRLPVAWGVHGSTASIARSAMSIYAPMQWQPVQWDKCDIEFGSAQPQVQSL
jgi:hypothetical protein